MNPTINDFMPSVSSVIVDITGIFSPSYLYQKIVSVPINYRQRYMEAIEMSEVYGRLLAHMLMLQYPFKHQNVSLFGVYLGAQVLYSCLEELYKRNAYNIVYNVYFVEGAAEISDHKEWAKVLKVARGTVYNFYNRGQKYLHIFRTTTFKYPVGINPLCDTEIKPFMSETKKQAIMELKEAMGDFQVVNIDASKANSEFREIKNKLARTLAAVDFTC